MPSDGCFCLLERLISFPEIETLEFSLCNDEDLSRFVVNVDVSLAFVEIE